MASWYTFAKKISRYQVATTDSSHTAATTAAAHHKKKRSMRKKRATDTSHTTSTDTHATTDTAHETPAPALTAASLTELGTVIGKLEFKTKFFLTLNFKI